MDRVTELLIEKGYSEGEIEKAKGGSGQWVRDKIGRFASKPGGGGGSPANKRVSRPAPPRKTQRELNEAATGAARSMSSKAPVGVRVSSAKRQPGMEKNEREIAFRGGTSTQHKALIGAWAKSNGLRKVGQNAWVSKRFTVEYNENESRVRITDDEL